MTSPLPRGVTNIPAHTSHAEQSATEIVLAGFADALGLPFELVEPLLETQRRARESADRQPDRLVGGDPAVSAGPGDVLKAERERAQRLVNLQGEQVVDTGHHKLLTLHGLPTRYVASALFLAACWWLQRKAWTRRAAGSRPSGTTQGGAS